MEGPKNRLKLEQYLKGKLDAAQEYERRDEDVVIDMPHGFESQHQVSFRSCSAAPVDC